MVRATERHFQVATQFVFPLNPSTINQVFLINVLARITPEFYDRDTGYTEPLRVDILQASFRGVNIFQDLHENQVDALVANVMEQMDDKGELPTQQELTAEAHAEKADHERDVARDAALEASDPQHLLGHDENREEIEVTNPLVVEHGPLGMGG